MKNFILDVLYDLKKLLQNLIHAIFRILAGLLIIAVCVFADILCYIWMIPSMIIDGPRWWKIAVGKDQAFNAAIGGFEDETLSSRAARAHLRGERWGCYLCKFLDVVDKNHCKKSLGR